MIKRLFQAFVLLGLLIAAIPMSLYAQTAVPSAARETLTWGDGSKALAFFARGKTFHDGDGVQQNYSRARTYYIKAANLGNNDARVNLGYLYFMGEGVEQNYAKARNWYLSAARDGDSSAQLNLAMIYENGLGVRKNPQRAQYWRELSRGTSAIDAARPATIKSPVAQAPQTALPQTPPPPVTEQNILASTKPQTTHAENTLPSYTAPVWISPLIVFIMFMLAVMCALWFILQYRALKKLRLARAFGDAFYASHRDTVRTSYLRYPESRRDYGAVDGPWAVALCVLMVRFAKENSEAPSWVGQQSRKTLRALDGGGFFGRQSVFPIVARLQARICADINAVDNAPEHILRPLHFRQDLPALSKAADKSPHHLQIVKTNPA